MRTILFTLVLTAGLCGSAAGQGMFLPSDENGSYAELGYIHSRFGGGLGMGLGMASGGVDLEFTASFLDGKYISSSAFGLFGSLDVRRLGRMASPVSLQVGGGFMFGEGSPGFAFGPMVYVESANPNGFMACLHGGVMVTQSFGANAPAAYPTSLGASIGSRSKGLIVATTFTVTFDDRLTTYTIGLSLGSRKPQSPRFDDHSPSRW